MSLPAKKYFILLLSCALLALSKASEAKSLYVFDDASGEISEYDVKTFKAKRTLKVPNHLPLDAQLPMTQHGIEVSASGKIMRYRIETDHETGKNKVWLWFWDGAREVSASETTAISCVPAGDSMCNRREAVSAPVLDASEPVFYRVKDLTEAFRKYPHEEEPIYLMPRFEIYRASFSEDKPSRLMEERIAKVSMPECECSTGACSESCPVGHLIAPKEGVGNFFEVEHFVEGQIGSKIVGSTYFEKNGTAWVETSVNKKLEKPFLKVIPDGGCCGWINEGSDVILLIDGKTQKTVYDEWERFGNRNYDVSFRVSGHELSPDARLAAYTIELDAYMKNGAVDFRLTPESKEDLAQLSSIKAALPGLPMVEVKRTDDKLPLVASVKNAEFIDWADSKRLFLLKGGRVVVLEALTGKTTETPLKAKSVRNVFVR